MFTPNINASGLVLLDTQSASSSASIAFTGLDSTYKEYIFELSALVPQTDAVNLYVTFSVNNGSSYLSTVYSWSRFVTVEGGAFVMAGASSDAQIIMPGLGNATGENGNFSCKLYDPASAVYKLFTWNAAVAGQTSGAVFVGSGAGSYLGATQAINAIKFAMSSGNIASGVFKLYGMRSLL